MLRFFIGVLIIYVLFCFLMYLLQNKLLFHPEKLPASYKFAFDMPFEEINYETEPGITINALKFKAENPQGIVLYLHGNAGSLRNWGYVADIFVQSGYDCLMIDYRGYGKSTGEMTRAGAIHDLEYIYNKLKEEYGEENITLFGRSLGSGMAAYLAAHYQPQRLILESPYYSLSDVATRMIPIIPPFLLRFDFATYQYMPEITCPVYIFHGTEDEVIYYGSSQKLKEHFKEKDRLLTIEGGGHNNLASFVQYDIQLKEILQSNNSSK
jgi:uncharacterized protein